MRCHLDGIGKTSLLTAAMRAAETRRGEAEGRLFSDPYAELLAGEEGQLILEKAIAASGDQPAIAIRTAFMDSRILDATQNGYQQIVILAAGMDTRAFRLPLPKGTRIFELDRKEVLNYKEKRLSPFNPISEKVSLAVDLLENWTVPLLKSGFKMDTPTIWLVEGLLMYLEEDQVSGLLNRIDSLASLNDFMLMDILSRTLLEVPHMKNQLQFLAALGAPWRFGVDEPDVWLQSWGWQAKLGQPADFAPSRWPFPSVPLSIPNVPRGYYIEARKVTQRS